jgi:hypothetical protein
MYIAYHCFSSAIAMVSIFRHLSSQTGFFWKMDTDLNGFVMPGGGDILIEDMVVPIYDV